MNIVIITLPNFFDGEAVLVNQLFRLGMQRLHLRKPQSTKEELQEWIKAIDTHYHQHIVLHDHHSLALEFGLGGIHLNSRNPNIPSWAIEKHITISRSCHSIEEITRYKTSCDYLFLSPIFDSISKEGYGAAFPKEELTKAFAQGILDHKVYALGGISSKNLSEVKQIGFQGAAILGDIWLSDSPTEKFASLIKIV